MKIKWVVLKDFPNYEVNRLGKIRRKNGRELKPYVNSHGYLHVDLHGKRCKLHRLIAETFLPNPEGLPVVNHKKGIKTDCRASQLEWCSQADNVRHAWRTGLRKKEVI